MRGQLIVGAIAATFTPDCTITVVLVGVGSGSVEGTSVLVVPGVEGAEAGTVDDVGGRVVDGSTGAPVSGAAVAVIGADAQAVTDADSCFTLSVPAGGRWTLRVSHGGFESSRDARIGGGGNWPGGVAAPDERGCWDLAKLSVCGSGGGGKGHQSVEPGTASQPSRMPYTAAIRNVPAP